LRLDFILSGLNGGAGVGGEAIDGARKNSGGQNNRLTEKKAGLRETSLVFHLYILIKPFSFWTSLPSFWLPFLTPFKSFSSFSRVEYFIRTPDASASNNLPILSKKLGERTITNARCANSIPLF